jgi:hypothetical protein
LLAIDAEFEVLVHMSGSSGFFVKVAGCCYIYAKNMRDLLKFSPSKEWDEKYICSELVDYYFQPNLVRKMFCVSSKWYLYCADIIGVHMADLGFDRKTKNQTIKLIQEDGKYCIPGGSVEQGETPFEAFEREAKEEGWWYKAHNVIVISRFTHCGLLVLSFYVTGYLRSSNSYTIETQFDDYSYVCLGKYKKHTPMMVTSLDNYGWRPNEQRKDEAAWCIRLDEDGVPTTSLLPASFEFCVATEITFEEFKEIGPYVSVTCFSDKEKSFDRVNNSYKSRYF